MQVPDMQRVESSRDLELQGCRILRSQGSKVQRLQGSRNPRLQVSMVSKVQDFRVPGAQGSRAETLCWTLAGASQEFLAGSLQTCPDAMTNLADLV